MKQKPKCLYCNENAENKEHVPSKNLLEKPYPNNLFTFDACLKCNGSFSLDEEYFLNVLATLSLSPTLQSRTLPGGSIYRSRERSDKLYQRLVNSLVKENEKTYFKPETKRIRRIIEKYTFGIFYSKYKKVVPLNLFKCVGFYPFNAEETRPHEIILLTHTEKFKPKKWITIQDNVFSYIIVRDSQRNNKLTMIMQIHNTAWFVIQIPYPTSNKWNKRNLDWQYNLFQ